MAVAIHIPGDFDHNRFCKAFASVVARSDALRSVFVENDGVPHRNVLPHLDITPEFLDLGAESDPSSVAQDIMSKRSQRLFDLKTCLIDSAILRISPRMHIWFLNQHHLITDGRSKSNLVDAVRRAYTSNAVESTPLPAFQDYATWEAAQADTARMQNLRAFWDSDDRSDFAPVPLRADIKSAPDSRARRVSVQLTPEQNQTFRTFAERPDVRMFNAQMSYFSIFATALLGLLHRLSGEDRVAIGTSSQNRGGPTFANTLGYFVELYPFGASLDETETFRSLLTKVQAETQSFLTHAHPGAATSEMQRRFNVVLNYITAEIAFSPDAPPTEWIHTGHSDAGHGLRVEVQDFAGRGDLTVMFDISESEFGADNAIIDQFMIAFQTLLEAPDTQIGTLELPSARSLLTPASQQNAMRLPLQQFARILSENADHPAVTGDDADTLTYGLLDQLSTKVARYLIAQAKVKPGDLVGLMADRNSNMLVSLLAILKAGAGFVPLDPSAPLERQETILNDTCAKCVLAPRSQNTGLPVRRILTSDALSAASSDSPLPQVTPEDTAYVIYTSGSTGTPNGVVIEHRNIAHLVAGLRETSYNEAPASKNVALVAPLVFDAAIQQIFGALMQGHHLFLVPEETRMSGEALAAFFDTHDIQVSDGTPAHLGLLAETSGIGSYKLPDLFLIGGEALKRQHLEQFYAAAAPSAPRIANVYGVAECCVDSISQPITKDDLQTAPPNIPIGTPLPGTTIRILNPSGTLQPPNLLGEIAISGPGVGRGYLNRETLNKARFVRDPTTPDQRMYLTGDLGWYDTDGTLHFEGRRDTQIKVNGIRIECDEIRHQLLQFDETAPNEPDYGQPEDIAQDVPRCTNCVLSPKHPGVTLNADGLCSVCENWSQSETAAHSYFQDLDAFDTLLSKAAAQRPPDAAYDCMLLFSGGKDSSYVLHRLVERGLRVLAFTFDNGFISKSAFEAIRRQTEKLNVTSVIERTDQMDDIFVESLRLDNTVCSGCFRALTTLSTRMAHDMGINVIVTGLSRGQIFDTKLDALYHQGITDVDRIEDSLGLFRQVFHANQDRTARILNDDLGDVTLSDLHFVDFFRYDAAGVNEVRSYLQARDPYWINPQDTGFCSTNCLMNDVGICVHSNRQGFHNYEAPLSWDIRLGVANREDVLQEVTAPLNLRSATTILERIGFFSKCLRDVHVQQDSSPNGDRILTAYFTASQTIDPSSLRSHLATRLPSYMLPSRFVQVARIPLTHNGKVDHRALQALGREDLQRHETTPPNTPVEALLVEIWQSVLQREDIGIRDNFFDLGGDSIGAIRIVGRANAQGFRVSAKDLLALQTIEGLADRISPPDTTRQDAPANGQQICTHVLKDYLKQSGPEDPPANAMVLDVNLGTQIDTAALERALQGVVDHHDIFRLRAHRSGDTWDLAYAEAAALETKHLKPVPTPHARQVSRAALRKLALGLSLTQGRLVAAALMPVEDESHHLLLALHHVTCDFVSLTVFIEDLNTAYQALLAGRTPSLAPVSTSFQSWATLVHPPETTDTGNSKLWQRRLRPEAGQLHLGSDPRDTGIKTLKETRNQEALPAFFQGTHLGLFSAEDAILSAVATACAAHSGRSQIQIDVERHGRDGPNDLSRTMGWFTAIHPVSLSVPDTAGYQVLLNIAAQSKAAKQQATSFRKLPYDIANALPKSDILLNYIGAWGGLETKGTSWTLASEVDQVLGPKSKLPRLAVLNITTTPDSVALNWQYDPAKASRAVLQQISQRLFSSLEEISASALAHHSSVARAAQLDKSGLTAKSATKVDALLQRDPE